MPWKVTCTVSERHRLIWLVVREGLRSRRPAAAWGSLGRRRKWIARHSADGAAALEDADEEGAERHRDHRRQQQARRRHARSSRPSIASEEAVASGRRICGVTSSASRRPDLDTNPRRPDPTGTVPGRGEHDAPRRYGVDSRSPRASARSRSTSPTTISAAVRRSPRKRGSRRTSSANAETSA